MKNENINHPNHYNFGKIEVIDFLKDQDVAKDFCVGNIIKYVARYKYKEKPIEDLKKAKWYLEYLIGTLEDELKTAESNHKNEVTNEQ